MDEKKDTLQFACSQEELLVILSYLGTKQLVGFDLEFAQVLSEEQLQLSLEVAERGLFSRGLLGRDKEMKLFHSPVTFSTVGACAAPELTVMLNIVDLLKGEDNYYFHISRKMHVIHYLPHPMIHQFVVMDGIEKFQKAIFGALSLPATSHPEEYKGGEIAMSTLKTARVAAKEEGAQGALNALKASSLQEQEQKAFADALTNPAKFSTVSLVNSKIDKVDGFSLLQGQESIWILVPSQKESQQGETAFVTMTSPEYVVERIAKFINNKDN